MRVLRAAVVRAAVLRAAVLRAAAALLAASALAACAGPGAPSPGDRPPPSPSRPAPPPARVLPSASAAAPSSAGTAGTARPSASAAPPAPPEDPAAQKARIVAQLAGRRPRAWGTDLPGVLTTVAPTVTPPAPAPASPPPAPTPPPAPAGTPPAPVLALTFDACGGPGGDGHDAALIELLRRERIPATLFLTSRWIAARRAVAASLAADPLFEIENHGSAHRPCSVTGRAAFGIRGTRGVGGAVDEIRRGASAIAALTGRSPRFYRPGTAYFDDVCLDVVAALGEAAAGFAVNGDGGTGFTRAQVKAALLKAKPGSIVLLHMNHPAGQTAEGLADALPALRARGVRFVRLADAIAR